MICPVCETEVPTNTDGYLFPHERVVEMPGWNGTPKAPRACLGSGLHPYSGEEYDE